ncbi:hypothetical protein [Shewanella aquimarina]|uniref:hypothetical protein n=1 Tax=Shewanella aquimarina TaxID=260365 RepID=UPI002014D615|nr:hypothetical protein [Shewanella aquimarina]MCL2909004.1 hypothetical protein [Shewanella aquimarina]
MKKWIALLFICITFYSVNAHATKLYSCFNCSAAKLNAIIDTHVQTTKTFETIVLLDREKTTSIEVRLRPAGNHAPGSPIPYISEIYTDLAYLQAANGALAELKAINEELTRQADLGFELPAETGFKTVADALREIPDLQSVLNDRFNRGESSTHQKIAKRADKQVQLLGNALGFSPSIISVSLWPVVKNSSWIVSFADGSQILVDITFKSVNDQLLLATKALAESAQDNEDKRVPLSDITAEGYRFSGSYVQVSSYAELMRSFGINGSVPDTGADISCSVTKSIEASSHRITYGFSCG